MQQAIQQQQRVNRSISRSDGHIRHAPRRFRKFSYHCSAACSYQVDLSAAVLQPPQPQVSALRPCIGRHQLVARADGKPPKLYDYLGLAQSMVDFTAAVPAHILAEPPFSVQQGFRRVISLQERHAVIERLEAEGCESQVSPGGSLANTLVALSRIAKAHGNHSQLAMSGCVGSDTLGSYFNAQLEHAGVNVLVDHDNMSHTGTVMVLTTPDAQRSFLSFFDSGALRMTRDMSRAISRAQMVIIEGYMLEMPGAAAWAHDVARIAHSNGAQVVLTAGDPTVVSRHRNTLRSLLADGLVDILFCNRDEACELVGCDPDSTACTTSALAEALSGVTTLAVVTDGSHGACIATHGDVHHIPPHWAPKGPVDVCGAGDAFAAGVLYAHNCGYSVADAGAFASRVAAAVISRHGAQLDEGDARELVRYLPDHVSVDWVVAAGTA